MKKFETREEWLNAAINKLCILFVNAGYALPSKIRVSCGWPSGNIKKSSGECWSKKCSKDGTFEIFVSPSVDNPCKKSGVLAILVHELVHAVVGLKVGHKALFKRCAKKVGLAGKMTSSVASKDLLSFIKQITHELGQYPHAAIQPGRNPFTKKQSTRLIKVGCPKCDYIARVTRIHLDGKGAPLCPVHKVAFDELD